MRKYTTDWLHKDTVRKWETVKWMKQAKELIGTIPPINWQLEINTLNRYDLRLVVSWLTRH